MLVSDELKHGQQANTPLGGRLSAWWDAGGLAVLCVTSVSVSPS